MPSDIPRTAEVEQAYADARVFIGRAIYALALFLGILAAMTVVLLKTRSWRGMVWATAALFAFLATLGFFWMEAWSGSNIGSAPLLPGAHIWS